MAEQFTIDKQKCRKLIATIFDLNTKLKEIEEELLEAKRTLVRESRELKVRYNGEIYETTCGSPRRVKEEFIAELDD